MPGVAIVGAVPSVIARGLFVTRGVVLHRPGDWMAVHFSSAGVQFARVPTWLLVRTLGAVDREWVVYFPFLMTPVAGSAAWIGAGGKVGVSDRLIAVAMSRVRWRSVVPGILFASGAREMQYSS